MSWFYFFSLWEAVTRPEWKPSFRMGGKDNENRRQEWQETDGTRKGAVLMEVRNINGHYEIYKDGKFVCSCDAGELKEVVEEILD